MGGGGTGVRLYRPLGEGGKRESGGEEEERLGEGGEGGAEVRGRGISKHKVGEEGGRGGRRGGRKGELVKRIGEE